MEHYTTIKTLWEKCGNKSKIAEITKFDWKTVSKIVNQIKEGKEYPVRKEYPRILDNYKENILEWIEKGLNGVRIYEELKIIGVNVSYSTVKDFISLIKEREKVFLRVHTLAGEEAQVDFGYLGLISDNGKKRKIWVFNMRLSYSRLDYYEAVYDQSVETFIRCHINAFNYFGGIPEYVKIDNLKSAILEANFYEPIYQKLYQVLANYYEFKPLPCRVRHPNDKGKVESGIKYVKGNFFRGRNFVDFSNLQRQLKNWTQNICNKRIHGTTRKIPIEVFELEEKAKLKPLPDSEFEMSKWKKAKVYHDCHVFIDYSYYSVPFEYVGKEVEIEIKNNVVKIYYKNNLLAIHEKAECKGKFQSNPSHYPKYKMYSSTELQEKYQIKMREVGYFAEQMFFCLLKTNPRDWNRSVSGILSLIKKYPKEVVDTSCKRALAYEAYGYRIVLNICESGSYLLPLEFDFDKENVNYEYVKK